MKIVTYPAIPACRSCAMAGNGLETRLRCPAQVRRLQRDLNHIRCFEPVLCSLHPNVIRRHNEDQGHDQLSQTYRTQGDYA
jgi:hypothetical protein